MDEADLLAALPGWAFAFVLVLARVASACMLLPGIGEADLPAPIRAAFALAFTLLILPAVAPLMPTAPAGGLGALLMVAGEAVAGLWLGWLARLVMLALPMAGQVAAGMIGLSNVLQPDVQLGAQTSALSRLFGLAAPVAVVAAGLHALPLAALQGSYAVMPAGAPWPAGDAAEGIVTAVAESFALALRLAAPFVLAAIVWHVALGLLTRLVPQLQVYFTAMPGQILGGFILVALLSGAVLAAWLEQAGVVLAGLPGL